MEGILHYKVAILGNGAVGKTSLVKRFTTGEYRDIHVPTLGVEQSVYPIYTTRGPILFDIRDCAGIGKFGAHLSGFLRGTQAAVVVFAMDSMDSYTEVPNWVSLARSGREDTPILLCGNKEDSPNHEVDVENVLAELPRNSVYLSISTRDSGDVNAVFLELARLLMGCTELELI